MDFQQQSRLMQLPAELQLTIFEYVVIEHETLLINCGCDSSYRGDWDKWEEDRQLWASGQKQPPQQPGLTRTCKVIRSITLPMFYTRNVFRAHYCYETDFPLLIRWLTAIGLDNRMLLRDFALWDWNRFFDRQVPSNILKAKRSDLCRGLKGKMETLEREQYCCHKVTFGDGEEEYYDLIPQLFEQTAEN